MALQFSGCDTRHASTSESKKAPESEASPASLIPAPSKDNALIPKEAVNKKQAALRPLETLGEDPEVIIPEDSGYVDVTKPPYNAKGDGVTDDTRAIQQAIFDAKPLRGGRGGQAVVYLPAGTYRVTNTLGWYQVDGTQKAYVALVGAGRTKTIIRLADVAPGFTEAAKPKSVILTNNSTNTKNVPPWNPNTGNEAFANYITDLTVDTGMGNPGAVGIDFIGHNSASTATVRFGGCPLPAFPASMPTENTGTAWAMGSTESSIGWPSRMVSWMTRTSEPSAGG